MDKHLILMPREDANNLDDVVKIARSALPAAMTDTKTS
jgi:hypothetical protein